MAQEYSASMTAKLLGVSASTLKQWEKHFPELAAHQDAKGKNIYTDKEIELLKNIQYLTKERGFTLEGARKEIDQSKNKTEQPSSSPDEGKRAKALAQLKSLRGFLMEIKSTIQR